MSSKTTVNSSQRKTIVIVLLGAIVFFVSLCLLPRSPKVDQEKVSVKIAKETIAKGNVMEGVQMLKGVLEKNENNVDAIWELGKLSYESTQYGKAIERFKKFITLAEGEDKAVGLVSLADAYFMNNEYQEARTALLQARNITQQDKLLEDINKRLGLINKN